MAFVFFVIIGLVLLYLSFVLILKINTPVII